MQRFIPVVVIKELAQTNKILTALKNNNIYCAEITFRTDCATEAIAYAVEHYPDMEIGAGTVINAEQCEAALAAGATFIVSPGLSPDVAKICNERNIPYYPGCVTPTEIMAALESVAKQLADKFGFEKVAITLRSSISASDNDWAGMLYDGENYCFSKSYHLSLYWNDLEQIHDENYVKANV